MPNRAEILSRRRLIELLDYNPDTGQWIWKEQLSARGVKGTSAGTIDPNGYRVITIARTRYYAHRLAWFYVTARWPIEIDHINLDRSDNRWANLREASHQQNCRNVRKRQTNKCGFKGVYEKRPGRWTATINMGGKTEYLGTFDTPELAAAAWNEAARNRDKTFHRF